LYALETGMVVTSGEPRAVVRHREVVRSYLGDDPSAIERSHARARTKTRTKTRTKAKA
jgi:hypothetical protein